MAFRNTFFLLALTAALVACRRTDAGPDVSGWFSAPAPVIEQPPCRKFENFAGAQIDVKIYIGSKVDSRQAQQAISDLRGYGATIGLQFVAQSPRATPLSDAVLFAASRDELQSALQKAGLVLGSTEPGASAVVSKFVGDSLRRFVKKTSQSHADGINVVFLKHIMATDSPLLSYLGTRPALTLSPFQADAEKAPPEWNLPTYGPTIFVSLDDLGEIPPLSQRGVLLHEFGHALGLVHHRSNQNVMAEQRSTRCLAVFDRTQTALLRKNLQALHERAP